MELRSQSAPRATIAAFWIFYAIAWLAIIAVNVAALLANGLPLDLALRNAIAYLLPDAVLGIAVLHLPRLLPWQEGRLIALLGKHCGLVAGFITLSSIGWFALIRLDSLIWPQADSNAGLPLRLLPWRIANDMLVYGACAGLAYAWQGAAAARDLAAQVARAEALRARAQLEVMRNQLNPHFMLNSLHALMGLVRRQPDVAEDALERLGGLLRYSLQMQREGVDEVLMRDEWSFVQDFLDIERLRLGQRLTTCFRVPQELLDFKVPTFALQTLVENAIKHSIAPSAAGGSLDIDVALVGNRLRMQVTDVAAGTNAALEAQQHGVGLALLKDRLQVLYRGDASLALQELENGTRAVLELPARLSETAHD